MAEVQNHSDKTMGGARRGDDEMAACIDACTSCHRACLQALRACLEMGGQHADPEHLTLFIDCADICATSGDFMLRSSAQHGITCDACARICRACAASCRQLGGEAMEACAKACDACAESCEGMARSTRASARH